MIDPTPPARHRRRALGHHVADTCYLQGIMVTFLIASSAALFLYTTLNDPLREVTATSKEQVPMIKQQASFPFQKLVEVQGLQVIPLHQILVHADAADEVQVKRDEPNANQPSKKTRDVDSLQQGGSRRDFALALNGSRKAARRGLARAFSRRHDSHHAHHHYTLDGDLRRHYQSQLLLVDQLFVSAGYFLAAIFIGVVIVKVAVDGGLFERNEGKDGGRTPLATSSLSPEGQQLLSYGSFGSTDHVSDWSGDYFDRFDV